MAATHHLREERVLSRMPIATCLATEGSVLVSQMPQTFHALLPYLAQAYAAQCAHILGACVVLDTEGTGPPDTEALPREREDRVLLVQAIQNSFAAARSHLGRYSANGRGVLQEHLARDGEADRIHEDRLSPLPRQGSRQA